MSNHDEHTQFAPGYQHQSIEERVVIKWAPIWASVIGLVTLIVVALGLVRAFELALAGDDNRSITAAWMPADFQQAPGTAPLNPAQVAQKEIYEEHQQHLLTTYGWANQEKKLARIPLDRAKALIVEKYGQTQ